LNSSVD